jgi:glycosyltransferase involved in cell wall biosynthesis
MNKIQKIIPPETISSKEISIIIPVKDNQEGINRLLHSIFERTAEAYLPREIIIVDNLSKAVTVVPDELKMAPIPIHVIECLKPGPGNARNAGAKYAYQSGAKWGLFIDSDCLMTAETMQGYCQPAMPALAHQGDLGSASTDWLSQFYVLNKCLQPKRIVNEKGKIIPAYLVTANVLIYLEAFNAINGFDEEFETAAEDVDIGYRISMLGPLAYNYKALANHDFLEGGTHLELGHIRDFFNRYKKYSHGERCLIKKYHKQFEAFKAYLAEHRNLPLPPIPYNVLDAMAGIATREGVAKNFTLKG